MIFLTISGGSIAHAAGVVGDGTPDSCTESALNTVLFSASSVKFDCGGEHTITLTAQKTIDTDTTIDGDGLITLSGGGSTRLFNVLNGAHLTLLGLTITNGFSKNDGDGVYVERLSNLTVNESTFQNNTGYNGGGIATNGWGWDDDGVVLNISDSTFSNNIATAPAIAGGGNGGGGIYLSGGSSGTFVNSSFSNNQSSNGGAIHLLHSNLKVTNVYFSNNRANNAAGGGGGAIYMDGTKGLNGEVRIELSTFDGNSTNQLGGAFFSYPEGSGGAFINQSSFDGNISKNRGQDGAIKKA